MVFMVLQAREANLKDDLNDFASGEDERPTEIYNAWTELGCPSSFTEFLTARKGKGREVDPLPANSTSSERVGEGDDFTGALSAKFGLPEAQVKAFATQSIARAYKSAKLPKSASGSVRYKALQGEALEAVTECIDSSLMRLCEISEQHVTDPTGAMKLFLKKLEFFTKSTWDQFQISTALERATTNTEDCSSGSEAEDEEQERESSSV